uniref:Hhh secreted protein n=1 Tax=Steinernema glaseri TaxID=37863 RepID=A0A1I7YGB9_9BILA
MKVFIVFFLLLAIAVALPPQFDGYKKDSPDRRQPHQNMKVFVVFFLLLAIAVALPVRSPHSTLFTHDCQPAMHRKTPPPGWTRPPPPSEGPPPFGAMRIQNWMNNLINSVKRA